MSIRPLPEFQPKKFTLTQFIVVMIVVGVIALIVLPSMQHKITHGGTQDSRSRLSNLGNALNAYHCEYNTYPQAITVNAIGHPMHSWRTFMFPIFGPPGVSDEFTLEYNLSEPWDGPNNTKLHSVRTPYFLCPNDDGPKNHTSYLAIMGQNTMFPEHRARSLLEISDTTANREAPEKNVVTGKGLTNTITLVESHKSNIHWMEPRDLPIDDAIEGICSKSSSISNSHNPAYWGTQHGALVLFADGSVRWISSSIDPKVLRSLIEIDNPDKPQEKYLN